MTKVIVTPLTVVSKSTLALLVAATAAIGCGGAGGGTRATGGAIGSGGHLGSAGSNGTGGNGTAGSTGAGGGVVCNKLTGALDCPNGVSPAAPLLADFSPGTWANTAGLWHSVACDLTGGLFSGAKPATPDAGAASSMTNAVTSILANPTFELKGTVQSGEYAYGGMQFDRCVNTTTYTGVQFTLGGTAAGCDLFVYVQTFDEQSITNHGGCDSSTTSCYNFPKKQITIDSAPVVVHFSELTGGTGSATNAQIVGLQWQFQSPAPTDGGAQPTCTNIDMTIDDVMFVTN